MTTRFKSRDELATEIAFRIADALRATGIQADFGKSNVSCSAYVDIGDGAAKLRISDHADHHGSDLTIRIDGRYTDIFVIYDDDGEQIEVSDLEELSSEEREGADFFATDIDDDDMDQLVAEGVTFAKTKRTD